MNLQRPLAAAGLLLVSSAAFAAGVKAEFVPVRPARDSTVH
jgi:hypothetical protein